MGYVDFVLVICSIEIHYLIHRAAFGCPDGPRIFDSLRFLEGPMAATSRSTAFCPFALLEFLRLSFTDTTRKRYPRKIRSHQDLFTWQGSGLQDKNVGSKFKFFTL
jgi:hypothetical protein